jgi:hypothetical protein
MGATRSCRPASGLAANREQHQARAVRLVGATVARRPAPTRSRGTPGRSALRASRPWRAADVNKARDVAAQQGRFALPYRRGDLDVPRPIRREACGVRQLAGAVREGKRMRWGQRLCHVHVASIAGASSRTPNASRLLCSPASFGVSLCALCALLRRFLRGKVRPVGRLVLRLAQRSSPTFSDSR